MNEFHKVIGKVDSIRKKSVPTYSVNSGYDIFGNLKVYGNTQIDEKTETVILTDETNKIRVVVNGDIPIFLGDDVRFNLFSGVPYHFENKTIGESGYLAEGVAEMEKSAPVNSLSQILILFSFMLYPLLAAFLTLIAVTVITLPAALLESVSIDVSYLEKNIGLLYLILFISFYVYLNFRKLSKNKIKSYIREKLFNKAEDFATK